ncbi:MAG: ABC transporter permease [Bacteroidia bacterium]|nr:ABC transporter permease [Bacteroidia bacterium]
MRSLRFLLEKEFRQIFRNPAILRMIFIMPVIQLIILPQVADYEIRNVKMDVIDHDHSMYSREMIRKITSSGCFELAGYHDSYTAALHDVEHDRTDLILEIPAGFERTLVRENEAPLFIAVNAINGMRANLGAAYLNSIIRDYNQEVRAEWIRFPRFDEQPRIEVQQRNWYNLHLNYKLFMVPGILVILLTMVGAFLAALNIVKEKEIGTIEQINVTPIRKHHFILGKLIPFWIMGLLVLSLGLLVARLIYGIVPVGNIGLIYLFAAIFLLAVLGLGLLISTISHTQQQAMLIAFFLMMIFILMGGLYTSIESMPRWAQVVTWFNPVTYFIDVVRMVVLKGSGLKDIAGHLGIIFIFAVVLNAWAVFSYRKRT